MPAVVLPVHNLNGKSARQRRTRFAGVVPVVVGLLTEGTPESDELEPIERKLHTQGFGCRRLHGLRGGRRWTRFQEPWSAALRPKRRAPNTATWTGPWVEAGAEGPGGPRAESPERLLLPKPRRH